MKIIDYKLLAFFCYKFLIMYATIYTWVKATKTTNCIFNTGIFFNLAKSLLIPEKKEYALDDAIKYPCYNLKTTFLHNLKNISPSAIFYKRNACTLKKNYLLTACTLNEYTCDNEKCINGTQHCDGVYDCTDQSDEKNCATTTPGKIYYSTTN